jgi:hypothetical protein
MKKVSEELARQEVEQWLQFKRVDADKIEENKDQIESLVKAISNGHLEMGENYVFKQTLKFPLQNEQSVTELTYKPRVTIADIKTRTQNVKSGDMYGLIVAHIAALTSENSAVVLKLDTEDYKVASAIAIFFL